MKVRTKLEQASLAALSKNSVEKVDVAFDKEKIDKAKLSKLERYFGSKSIKFIAEKALTFVAAAFMKPGQDLLELTKYDKMALIYALKEQTIGHGKTDKNMVTISIPLWQIAIITSSADDALPSAESLVMYSLYETLKRIGVLFCEETESGRAG